MKKRTAVIAALVSLLPMGQTLVIGSGAALTSTAVMLSVPESAKAESVDFFFHLSGINKGKSGDYYGAISDYTKAIEINPKLFQAYYNRGRAKNSLKDYSGALSDYTKVIEINPRYKDAYIARAITKGRLEDYSGVISDATKAIEINPKDEIAYGLRGYAKQVLGDMQGACFDWRKASSLGETGTNLVIGDLRKYCS